MSFREPPHKWGDMNPNRLMSTKGLLGRSTKSSLDTHLDGLGGIAKWMVTMVVTHQSHGFKSPTTVMNHLAKSQTTPKELP